MPREIKQKGGTDNSFGIKDAAKNAKIKHKQLQQASGVEPQNEADAILNELDNNNDQFKELFEG